MASTATVTECPICMEEIGPHEPLGELLPCHHKFHSDCIRKWHTTTTGEIRRPLCPFCREQSETLLIQYDHGAPAGSSIRVNLRDGSRCESSPNSFSPQGAQN
ncbi:ubiquitin-protein ligase ASR1 KNAG_0A07430 [Huiozyma naganishii CBS 8797]|uniref:RING-type domain-containing protein n=1 Tax=Huiozyma naganishii (strain ATCC MYA-139 / BCRC 22969 / CBS 8797 / KCTC 17520 / NBRC 10181 / NCYC 3082 / Yp74L-3) TaxID=1071383 RepID=J7S455_HUIN7|nr:hypothetical protein KNAG_0A07430 [Kazachstania naganishii CBS 8797]CCK68396.1 hypothetical protein KNAG_0A07430 [Kazachstania naganishii CBS 8797]